MTEAGDNRRGGAGAQSEYPLILTSFRLVQFCDQQHRNIPRLRRQAREPLLEINPETAAALNIQDQEWVRLETAVGSIRLKAKLNSFLHFKVVATQYGWWQACSELDLPGYDAFGSEGANVNLLIANDAIDPISGVRPIVPNPVASRKRAVRYKKSLRNRRRKGFSRQGVASDGKLYCQTAQKDSEARRAKIDKRRRTLVR